MLTFSAVPEIEVCNPDFRKILARIFRRVFAMKLIAKSLEMRVRADREGVGFVCYQFHSKSLKKLAGSGGALIRLNDSHSQ